MTDLKTTGLSLSALFYDTELSTARAQCQIRLRMRTRVKVSGLFYRAYKGDNMCKKEKKAVYKML